jgi:hypothetical protein
MRKLRLILPAAVMATWLAFGVAQAGAASGQIVYSSLPAKGVVAVPSEGAEADQFNQLGNEVILTKASTVAKVSVTMVSWACQTGGWSTGDCVTVGTPTFPTPVTLTIYKHSIADHLSGEVRPGAQIVKVTKTVNIGFRPSSDPSCPLEGGKQTMYRGSDGQCHHGADQNIVFKLPKNTKLPTVVVWGVSYNTSTSGPNPLGGSGHPQDSLNVGLNPKTTTGLNRTEQSIFWDTRIPGNTCGAPFVTGDFNRDGPCTNWAGNIPAAKFTTP